MPDFQGPQEGLKFVRDIHPSRTSTTIDPPRLLEAKIRNTRLPC